MPRIEISSYLKLVFFVSLLAIISAYFIEYVLGHQPCNLCLIERVPYVSSLIIVLVNFRYKQITKYSILLLSLIFFFSLIISIYHYGIEQGFFQESIVCGIKDSANILSKEELLEEL